MTVTPVTWRGGALFGAVAVLLVAGVVAAVWRWSARPVAVASATAMDESSAVQVPVTQFIREARRLRRTGRLFAVHRGPAGTQLKMIYLRDGEIAFASSSDESDRLGPLLLAKGRLTASELAACESTGVPLGQALVQAGHITPEGVLEVVREQMRVIVTSVAAWPSDSVDLRFNDGEVSPESRDLDLGLNTDDLIELMARAEAESRR